MVACHLRECEDRPPAFCRGPVPLPYRPEKPRSAEILLPQQPRCIIEGHLPHNTPRHALALGAPYPLRTAAERTYSRTGGNSGSRKLNFCFPGFSEVQTSWSITKIATSMASPRSVRPSSVRPSSIRPSPHSCESLASGC